MEKIDPNISVYEPETEFWISIQNISDDWQELKKTLKNLFPFEF